MFFKTSGRILISFFLVLSLLSCHLKIGESPPAADMPEYRINSCFSAATTALGEFFRGNGNESQIGDGWDCFASMVKEFKSKVRCKVRERCSPAEIAQFVEDNFFEENAGEMKQRTISAGLQVQLMKIKKLFLGGTLEYITPDEIDRVITLMSNLKALSLDINPSMKVLTLNWENKLKSSNVVLFDFEAVNENLVKLALRLNELIDKHDNIYQFDDFERLVGELGQFDGRGSWIETVHTYMPLVKKLKKSITGGNEESLKNNEWNLFLLLGSRLYIQFLRYYYFIKDLTPEDTSLRLAYSARTIEEVFQILYDLISYKESNQVSKAEVEDLFNSFSNLWPVFKTSPELVTELMKVKQVLVGGSELGFARADFLRAQKKVNLIKQVVEAFTPYYEFYGLGWQPELLKQTEAFAYFGKATKNFEEITSKMTDEFKFEAGYDLKSLLRLAGELDKLYPSLMEGSQESSFGKMFLKHACLLQMGSDILLDRKDSQGASCEQIVLTSVDLTKLFKKGSQVFTVFLDYYYFVSRSRLLFNDLEFQEKIRDFAFKIVQFFKTTIDDRASKRVSNYELKSIATELVKLQIIPKTIRMTTIDSMIDLVVTRLLVPDNLKKTSVRFDGIESFHVEQAYRELDNFLGINIFIHQIFENKINQKFDYNFLLGQFKKSLTNSTSLNFKQGMTEFVKNFQSPYPLILTSDSRLYFQRNANPTYDRKNLEALNLNRFLAGWVLRSYAKGGAGAKAAQTTLTDCELKAAFLSIKPILVDLDILSETTGIGFIDSRLVEANLFLTKSDGNDTLSFEELAEFVNYILSGFTIDSMVRTSVNSTCQLSEGNSETLVSLTCLRESYKKVMTTALNSMPSYLTYSQREIRNRPAEWDAAFLNNLKAAGYVPRSDLKISLGDSSLLPHILQYGETLFLKFDVNADGVIDKKEAIRAYPAFAQLLKKVARKQIENGDIKENELEALFTYILKYGHIPECNKFILFCLLDRNVVDWLYWKRNYHHESQTLAANRTQVSKILGIIADLVSTSPSVREDSCKL